MLARPPIQGSTARAPAFWRADPAAAAALIVARRRRATIAGAWFFELVIKLNPCPICLEQRWPYYIGIPLALVVAFAAWRGAPRTMVIVGLLALAGLMLWGVWLGVFHAGIEWKWWVGPQECSGAPQLGGAGRSAEAAADDQHHALRRGGVALSRHLARRLQRADLGGARGRRARRRVGVTRPAEQVLAMPFKLVMLPPQTDVYRGWGDALAREIPDIAVVVAESGAQAGHEIADADGAVGVLPQDLLAKARRLRWLQSHQAAPPAGYYYPELIAHPLQVTNMREIFNDHIGAHIMAYVLAFARGLHYYFPISCAANGRLACSIRACCILPPPPR